MPYTIEQQLKTKERLKELRNENGITSTKMPSELREYMTSACLIDYEETNPDKEIRFSKTKGMSIERLVALADYYNVSVDYILGRTDTRSKDYEVRELAEYVGASTKVIEGIIKMYKQVPAADIIFDRMRNTRYSTLFLQSVLSHITTTVSYQQRIGVNAGDLDELYEKLRKEVYRRFFRTTSLDYLHHYYFKNWSFDIINDELHQDVTIDKVNFDYVGEDKYLHRTVLFKCGLIKTRLVKKALRAMKQTPFHEKEYVFLFTNKSIPRECWTIAKTYDNVHIIQEKSLYRLKGISAE